MTGPASIDPWITCIDCGGRAWLLSTWPDDDPPVAGDVVAYRCEDCWDRWDLEVPREGGDGAPQS